VGPTETNPVTGSHANTYTFACNRKPQWYRGFRELSTERAAPRPPRPSLWCRDRNSR